MATVIETFEIDATPEEVWAVMGDPAAISTWHPAIATSPVVDGKRLCTLEGGGDIQESIVEHSDEDHFYAYDITSSPFPMRSYPSRIAVKGSDGPGAQIVWSTAFEPNDPAATERMQQDFRGIYRSGLERIRHLAEQSRP